MRADLYKKELRARRSYENDARVVFIPILRNLAYKERRARRCQNALRICTPHTRTIDTFIVYCGAPAQITC